MALDRGVERGQSNAGEGVMNRCRWPLTDDRPWRFCDAACRQGLPYCDEHMARAYQAGTAQGGQRPNWGTLDTATRPSRRHFNKHTDAKWGI